MPFACGPHRQSFCLLNFSAYDSKHINIVWMTKPKHADRTSKKRQTQSQPYGFIVNDHQFSFVSWFSAQFVCVCDCGSLRTIWVGFSRFCEQSLLIGWCLIPLSAHRCLYTHFFCHALIFIWFLFTSRSALLLSFSRLLSHSAILFSVSVYIAQCLRHCCLFLCVLKKVDSTVALRFTRPPFHISVSFSLYSDIGDLPFHACKWVYRLCVGVYVRLWETLSISAEFRFVFEYFELFNINEAVKRYLFYEKTSTRSDQRRQRVHKTRLRIKKKYRD